LFGAIKATHFYALHLIGWLCGNARRKVHRQKFAPIFGKQAYTTLASK
jgi:hypothetical protein